MKNKQTGLHLLINLFKKYFSNNKQHLRKFTKNSINFKYF